MLNGGAAGLGDSRLQNLSRLAGLDGSASRTLIRSPMLSQAGQVVRTATTSLNTERVVLEALDSAATRYRRTHDVVLMVELGDLREGIPADELLAAAGAVLDRPSLRLTGIGTNLACQNGVVPDDANMGELTRLALQVEHAHGITLDVVSGGNSANLAWALTTDDTGRVDELRVGEAILLGTEPLWRTPVDGLHTDAFRLVAEVIEVRDKPAQPWGARAQTAFGEYPVRSGTGNVRQAILALGRQDVDPDDLVPGDGIVVLGTSSDHLVLDVGDHTVAVGDEISFGLGYSALVRAMTSPFVTKVERNRLSTALAVVRPSEDARASS
jgi:predicted amino acid racemase